MKRLLRIGLLLGVIVIVGLGGAVLYKIGEVKKHSQSKLNLSLQNYAKELGKKGMKLDYEPFVCKGILYVHCQSPKIEVWKNERALFRLSDARLEIKDLDLKGLTLNFDSSLAYLSNDELRDYVQMLFPQKLHIVSRFTLDERSKVKAHTKANLEAQNLNYVLSLDWMLKSEMQQGHILSYFDKMETDRDPIYFSNFDSKLVAKDLHPTLFAVVKKHYGKLNLKEFQAMVILLAGVGKEQFNQSVNFQKIIDAVAEMAMGKRNELEIQIKTGDREFCLTCPNALEHIVQEAQFEVQ